MASNRALLKALISLVLIQAIVHLADGKPNSTNNIPPKIRLSTKAGQTRPPRENTSSSKRDPPSRSRVAADTPTLAFHSTPHAKSDGNRYSKRRNLNRRNPLSRMESVRRARYSVLQPFPLPTFSPFKNYGYLRNVERQVIPPHAFPQGYAPGTVPQIYQEQPPLVYINLNTPQNQNSPDSPKESVDVQPQNQNTQSLQRPVDVREAPGSEAGPNYNRRPLLTETPQNLQQVTAGGEVRPLQYYGTFIPSPAIPISLNYNVQRHSTGENQPRVQRQIQATAENKQDGERNEQQSIIVPDLLNFRDGRQENYRYYKIVISPEDARNIEKNSFDLQKLFQTKPEGTNEPENQATTSSSDGSMMEMQNRKMIDSQGSPKMMMQQPRKMETIQKPQNMGMEQENEMKKQEMRRQLERETRISDTVAILREMDRREREEVSKSRRQEAVAMEKQKEMERRRQEIADMKMEMEQEKEMQKQEMMVLQEMRRQLEMKTRIPDKMAILREMDRREREEVSKSQIQEALVTEKQREMERRRQEIADMKMEMEQEKEIQKQEMMVFQEMRRQLLMRTRIPDTVAILPEMDPPREEISKSQIQEAVSTEKQKETERRQQIADAEKQREMERRRQQIADRISETVYQQMMDLLGHLTGGVATQAEAEVPDEDTSAAMIVVRKQEDAGMKKGAAADSPTEAEMEMQKQKLMMMLLEQMVGMQKQNAVNFQEKRPIQTQKAMESLQRQQAMGMKTQPETERPVPVEMEAVKQNLMEVLVQKLTEMKQEQVESNDSERLMNVQKQTEQTDQRPATEIQKPAADTELQMIQTMEVLLHNIIEMRKQQLIEHQKRMGMKIQLPMVVGMPLQKTADMNAQGTMKVQSQSTVNNEAPMQIEVAERKATDELYQQTGGKQMPETMEVPTRQTVEEVNRQTHRMQNQHPLQIRGSGASSPNAVAQAVSDKMNAIGVPRDQPEDTEIDQRAKSPESNRETIGYRQVFLPREQPEDSEIHQRGKSPESNSETIGYRQVLIHIPHGLTRHPRIFAPQNNQRSASNGYIEENSNADIGKRQKHIPYSLMGDQETSVQQDLHNSDGAIVRLVPVIKSPVESKPRTDYDFRPGPISSYSPAPYAGHDVKPFFPESASDPRTVFRSNLYSYDDMSLYGGLNPNFPQIYKD